MAKKAKKSPDLKRVRVKGVVRKKTAGKRSVRKQNVAVSRPTKRAPKASRKAEGRKPKKVDVLSNRGATSATTNERRTLISIGGTEATSASVPVGQIDVHQLFGVLDDAGVIERVSERIAGTVLDRLQEKFEQFRQRSASHTRYAQGSEDTFDESEETAQGAPGDISAECSKIQPASAQGDDDELADSIAPKPFNEFDDETASQPPQKLSTEGSSSEAQQAPISEPVDEFDEFDDDISSQPPQKPSTEDCSSESQQAPIPEPVDEFDEFDEFADDIASQPPRKLSTEGCSSESQQAPIPEPVDEFDEFDDIASQPPQKLSTNVRSSESKQLTAQEIVSSFNEEFGHEVDDDF